MVKEASLDIELSTLLAAAFDAVLCVDQEGVVQVANPACVRLTGCAADTLRGQPLSSLFPPKRRALQERLLRRLLRSAELRSGAELDLELLHVDGRVLQVRASVSAALRRSGRVRFALFLHEAVDRWESLQPAVSAALVDAASIQEGLERLLSALGQAGGWDAGLAWIWDRPAAALRCQATWSRSDARVPGFLAASRPLLLPPRGSLPGEVFAQGQPIWSPLEAHGQEPHARSAVGAGLASCCALPIMLGDERLGVVELFSRQAAPTPDPLLLEAVAGAGRQLGSFIARKRAEDEAQAVFERSPLGIGRLDADGRVLQANPALAEMLARPAAGMPGTALESLVHADDLPAVRRLHRDLVSGRRERLRAELRFVRPGGESFWGSLTVSALRDTGDRQRDFIAMVEDVSERRRAEDALRQREGRFRTLVENASIAMALSDEQGRLVLVNPAYRSFLGYEDDELNRLPVGRLTHPIDRKAGTAAFRELLQGRREVVHLEQRMLRRDGAVVWGHVTASLVESEEGRFVIGMVQDMTERLRAERAVRESQEKSRFLATMSHELRTPLNSILGFSDLLSSGHFGGLNDRQQRYVQNIHSSGQHLLELVNELLDFGRIEAGQLDVPLSDLAVGPELEQCLAEVRPLADASTLSLSLTAEADLVAVANRLRLRQVLLNLLSNAIKFTSAGGRISVAGEVDDRSVLISVTDSGLGIPTDQQERIFHEFTQVDDGTERDGAGLGLALSKRLVELMGGTLTVASQPGVGSRFTVRLPRADPRKRRGARRDRVSELAELAFLDPLTGLPNRRAFEHTWKRELASAGRHSYPVSLAMVDVDHFKRVNDRLGHLEGDRFLKAVADALRRTVRSADIVARLGGDEFVVALPYTNLDGALRIAERLREGVSSLSLGLPCRVSIGVACSEQTPHEALLGNADKALYLAKSEGRNRVAAERP